MEYTREYIQASSVVFLKWKGKGEVVVKVLWFNLCGETVGKMKNFRIFSFRI
jgi:hypothetical protein